MKYLFVFKGQPLLLCFVCCKIAIQDFLRGLHKKKKNLPFHRRIYRRHITRRYFTESCKEITGFCHIHRRISDGLPTAFPTLIPTEYNPSVFHRELQKNNGILPHSPTDFRRIADGVSNSNTDGITDELSHACLTRVRLHEYRLHF
jgi:hypothetical protein